MLDMNVEDASAKFKGTVMMIDGCAKLVMAVYDIDQFSVVDIRSGMEELLPVNEKNLKAPERIGFVQLGHQVVYASRIAARMWKAGLSSENMRMEFPECPRGGSSKSTALSTLRRLNTPPLALALEGEYPSLKQAHRKAKQHLGTYAFDKQFAVDCNNHVWYKTYQVGQVVKGKIEFRDSAQSLQCLLGEQNA